MKQVKQLLDYCALQDDEITTFQKRDTKLAGHSDAGYTNKPEKHSRAGGHFYTPNSYLFPPNNGVVLTISQIIKAFMSSAVEAELGALLINTREALNTRKILKEMVHKQDLTPIQIENSIADGVIKKKIQPKFTKSMDMKFHWLRDRESQEQFRFFWRPGTLNRGD